MSDTTTETDKKSGEQPPDSINEFVAVGEYGFLRVDGPFSVEKEGTVWSVKVPTAPDDNGTPNAATLSALRQSEGRSATLIADGRTVGGGIVTHVAEPETADSLRIAVDQYLAGDDGE